MDATSANSVLNATAKTIVDLLWDEVCDGEWAMTVGRMENAMHTACAVIQHAEVIPSIVIAVEQLLHPENSVWPDWMAMIGWTEESVTRHAWARKGTIVHTEYESGDSSSNENMNEDEGELAYRRLQKEHAKGKKRADEMGGETSLGKRKAEDALEDESKCGSPQMCRSSSKMTNTWPTLIHRPGGRMTTAGKPMRPKRMTKGLKECRDNIESEDEKPSGDATAGSSTIHTASSIANITSSPAPASQSSSIRMPTPVPIPTQRRQGCHRAVRQPLAAPQPANACSTCVDFGVLCEPNPGYSCFTCRSCKKKCEQSGTTRGRSASHAHQPTQSRSADALSQRGTPARSRAPSEAPAARSRRPSHAASSKWGTTINTQPPANPQDRPNASSSSMGIILCILPLRATPATTIRMESATKTSAVKAPVNMGLIAGTTYSLGGNALVSHEEHCAALQRLETMEVENYELHGLITRALDHIEMLEQGMASLGRICEATRRSVATSPTDFDRADMGFPFERECSTAVWGRNLHPAEPSHSPSPSLPSSPIIIPSALNNNMRWHVGPKIIRSTTPMPPSASPWTSSNSRQSQSTPVTVTMHSTPQMTSADYQPIPILPPVPPPVSLVMFVPAVEVLAETESASDNSGSGNSD
ncbi:hypothetical protein PAXRUDRAFT_16284 [Paxillus rubicundulus Ve08.2h10]|uniref:Uncharacterized protein n=1 Tax=Paxillus rubicundulus Ve08.2h10 TaxID=930991 RepID=A0A0D0C9H8_9AGAM|nr:hypothetical protein PAXRUDRAFT_16284 [Paxillus rubicundulus Ve08.2h10]